MVPRTANAELQRDERFSGTCRLSNIPHPRVLLCILSDANDVDRGKQIKLEDMSIDGLKRLIVNMKLVKELAKKYDAFLPSLVPVCSRLASSLPPSLTLKTRQQGQQGIFDHQCQLKEVLYLDVAVRHVNKTNEQVLANVKQVAERQISPHQATMGKPVRLY